MSYYKEHFGGADRATFLKALAAEGVGLSPYISGGLHRQPWIENVLKNRVYKELFPKDRLQAYRENTACPMCDRVCAEMAMFWASGPLLAEKKDMQDVVDAIMKVCENRDELAKG